MVAADRAQCILLELLLRWTYLRWVEGIAIRDVNIKVICSTCEEENEPHCYIRCATLLNKLDKHSLVPRLLHRWRSLGTRLNQTDYVYTVCDVLLS